MSIYLPGKTISPDSNVVTNAGKTSQVDFESYPNDIEFETGEENEGLGDSNKPAVAVPPPLQERHHLELLAIIIGGSALAFNAGFINGVTYQVHNVPVTHVTGTTTKAGLMVGNNDLEGFSQLCALIFCFIFGSGITGSLMPHSSFHLGLEYGPLFLVGSVIFLAACLIYHFYPDEYYFFYLAAMGSGLQNAMTTRYSGNIIRTTHMTGTATDIGLVLGRIIMGDWKEMWKLFILIPLFVSFFVGGIISVYVFRRMGSLSLLVNVVVFFSIGLAYSFLVASNLNIPMWKAFFGFYELTNRQFKETKEKMKSAAQKIKSKLTHMKDHFHRDHHHHHHHKHQHHQHLILHKQVDHEVESVESLNEDENLPQETLPNNHGWFHWLKNPSNANSTTHKRIIDDDDELDRYA